MQPQVVLLANVGDLVDGVEGTVDGGACRGVDEQRHVTLQGDTSGYQVIKTRTSEERDTHLLLGIDDFGLQVCRDDTTSGRDEASATF